MTTQLSTSLPTKLAALAAALIVNSLMFGGAAYLFSAQVHAQPHVTGLANRVSLSTHDAAAV